ncbi:neuromedin-U receptor 2-like [Leptinotarsa decemlineata]|uniref:neuromedin-U receptor 2-like n=1 Tax=Leptinotarsa decemlineata TaxID=7539 RepID=UPI003D30A99E
MSSLSAIEIINLTDFTLQNFTTVYSINASTNTSGTIDLYPFEIVLPFTIIYVIIFIVGVIGNISTCVVIAKNKPMQTATNYYLFSLACSDMLLLVSGLPPEMYRIWSPDHYIFGEATCMIQGLTAETSANATVLTITAFTVERYVAICHPFIAHTWSKPSRAVRIIIATWIISLGLAIPQAIQFGVSEEIENGVLVSHCTVINNFVEHAFEISTFIIFVGPMILITVLYVLIGIQLWKSKNIGPVRSRSSVRKGEAEEFGRKSASANNAAQKRVVNMLIAVVVAFFICWAPFHTQRLLAVYLSTASEEIQQMFFDFYLYLMYTSGVLYFVSTCVNPVLYHIMSNKFRKAFKNTFLEVCGCKKNPRGDYSSVRKVPPSMRNMQRSVSEVSSFSPKSQKANKFRNSGISDTCRSSFLSHSSTRSTLYEKNKFIAGEPGTNAGNEGKRFFIFPLKFSRIFGPKTSEQGRNTGTISNSSLKDTDLTEFTDCDLVNNMRAINEDMK